MCFKFETLFQKRNIYIFVVYFIYFMDKKKVIETLFDKKVIKILRLFINNPQTQYYLREVARISKVSPASTFRILQTMNDLDLLQEHKVKHLKTYSLNESNASMFLALLGDKSSAISEFSEFIKTVSGVSSCIQHGKEDKNKVSILVVGEGINQEEIRLKVVDIKEKYDFNIIFLVLDPNQYEQMNQMGLYPGTKKHLI